MGTLASAHLEAGIIEQQLEKILSSSQFSDTTRLNRFLKYLVDQSLAGNSDALKGYAIGVDVFDKAEDFDPSIDTIVRVQAGKLRNRLDLYYAFEGKDDPLRIFVPKGSYAPVFEIALDPDAALDESSVSPGEEQAQAAAIAIERYSIAVLPFDNLSGDPGQEFLADGLTEEIINALAKFRELKVISRHSTFRYKDNHGDPREIGKELGVRYLLEGSVRRWNDQVRVTAQLIETSSGTHLTSEVYDRDMSAENLFDIQDDIASRIAAEIAEPHGVIHRAGSSRRAETNNLDAYECRLLASEYWRSPNQESHAKVIELLEQAVAIDSEYAGAWAMLAILYGDVVRGGYNVERVSSPLDKALSAAQRAVATDPKNAAGHHALFMTHFNRQELSSYREAAERAIALNPNYPDLLADYGTCVGFSEDWEKGTKFVERALELSPHPPGWYRAYLAVYHYCNKRYDEAHAQIEVGDLGAFYWGRLIRTMVHAQLGEQEQAKKYAQLTLESLPDFSSQIRAAASVWNLRENDFDHMCDGWRKAGLQIAD